MMEIAPPAPARPRLSRASLYTLAVGVLLAVYAAMSLGASLHKGPSFDEPEELAVGYGIWLRHDFRMEGANGDFVKRWATLPYLVSRPNFVRPDNYNWRNALPYNLGFEFFFSIGNQPEMLLLQSRAMMVLLGVALGWLTYRCAKDAFGKIAGLAALVIFAFSPNMLAFGAMVSTEIPTCLAMLGATWCIWRLLHRVTWGRVTSSLGFFILLALSKPSALVIFPITLVLVLAKLALGRPLEWQIGRGRRIGSRSAQLGVFAGLAALHGLVAWGAIWAHYDFRYAASDNRMLVVTNPIQLAHDDVNPMARAFLTFSSEHHFLPVGFLEGARRLLQHNDSRDAFLDGEWKVGGWPLFFLHALWEKTSPGLLLIFAVGLGSCAWDQWRRLRSPNRAQRQLSPDDTSRFYEAIPYLTLILLFFAAAMSQNLNIGHRHILPIYPALYILGGGGAQWVWAHRKKWTRLFLGALFLWRTSQAFFIYPDFLAYFNPLVGGPAMGYRHLVDSSLDWGMDLPRLKSWLEQHNAHSAKPVFLAFFGTDDPNHYGIACQRLPSFPEWVNRGRYPYQPGIYAVSATLFQTVYTQTFGPWNKVFEQDYQNAVRQLNLLQSVSNDRGVRAAFVAKFPPGYWEAVYNDYEKLRFARLCAWLRHNEQPDTSAGYSILIWDLNDAEVRAALYGPPVELEDAPVQ